MRDDEPIRRRTRKPKSNSQLYWILGGSGVAMFLVVMGCAGIMLLLAGKPSRDKEITESLAGVFRDEAKADREKFNKERLGKLYSASGVAMAVTTDSAVIGTDDGLMILVHLSGRERDSFRENATYTVTGYLDHFVLDEDFAPYSNPGIPEFTLKNCMIYPH